MSSWNGFFYNQNSDDKFEKWLYKNQQDIILRHDSDLEVDNFNEDGLFKLAYFWVKQPNIEKCK